MTTTIRHVNAAPGPLTIVQTPGGSVAMPGLLGAGEAMRFANAHFAGLSRGERSSVIQKLKPLAPSIVAVCDQSQTYDPAIGACVNLPAGNVGPPAEMHLWKCRPARLIARVPLLVITDVNGHLTKVYVHAGADVPKGAWRTDHSGVVGLGAGPGDACDWATWCSGGLHCENGTCVEDGASGPGKMAPWSVTILHGAQAGLIGKKGEFLPGGKFKKGVIPAGERIDEQDLAFFSVSCTFAAKGTVAGIDALGKPARGSRPAAPAGMKMRGEFVVDLPKHGVMWIARKFKVPYSALTRANPHIPVRAWNGNKVLDLEIGDVVFIPAFTPPKDTYWDPNFATYRPLPGALSGPGTLGAAGFGESCDWATWCAGGLHCDNGTCVLDAGQATPPGPSGQPAGEGDACGMTTWCGGGLHCEGGVCVQGNWTSPAGGEGDTCNWAKWCSGGLHCENGTCVLDAGGNTGGNTANPDNCWNLPGYDPNGFSGANCPDNPNAEANCNAANGHWSYPYGGTHGVCDCGPGMILGTDSGTGQPVCQIAPANTSGPCAGLAEGSGCTDENGTPGGTCIGGNCVIGGNCGANQHKAPSGACIDDPCGPCMDRSGPGAECYPITAATCGGVFDPSGPGGECCFNNCPAGEHYDTTYHTCYCDAGLVRDATSGDCVPQTTPPPTCDPGKHADSNGDCIPDGPPPHKDPCPKAPDGTQMVSYAGGPCVLPPATCPGGAVIDPATGKCPGAPPPPPGGGGKSSSGIGLVIGALAVATAVGVGLAINKKNKKK
jgi:hypothetical protein